MQLEEYRSAFKTAELSRDEHGVLLVRLHSKGSTLWWGALPHRELPELFAAIASDRANRVVVLTGTGERFVEVPPGAGVAAMAAGRMSMSALDVIVAEGNQLVERLLAIEVPVIAAVNGPVDVHSELAVLSDIVLCTDDTYFQDRVHFPMGLVPGDSMQVVWPLLLGPNRGRHFLLTGARLPAEEALRLGVVAEVLPRAGLLDRALVLARGLARSHPIVLRHTRTVLVRPLRRAIAEDLHLGLALEALAMASGGEPDPDRPTPST